MAHWPGCMFVTRVRMPVSSLCCRVPSFRLAGSGSRVERVRAQVGAMRVSNGIDRVIGWLKWPVAFISLIFLPGMVYALSFVARD